MQMSRSDTPANVGSMEGCALYAKRPGFGEWKSQVDAIADSEGLTSKENLFPGELDVWIKHFNEGKTPTEAWRSVPYRKTILSRLHRQDTTLSDTPTQSPEQIHRKLRAL
jgi:hypothetical protein